jgi:hypothetical protein
MVVTRGLQRATTHLDFPENQRRLSIPGGPPSSRGSDMNLPFPKQMCLEILLRVLRRLFKLPRAVDTPQLTLLPRHPVRRSILEPPHPPKDHRQVLPFLTLTYHKTIADVVAARLR